MTTLTKLPQMRPNAMRASARATGERRRASSSTLKPSSGDPPARDAGARSARTSAPAGAAMLLSINPDHPSRGKSRRAVDALDAGEVIAYPTDTVYGMGCDLTNKRAVERLYAIKRMDRSHPLAFVCPDLSDIARYAIVEKPTLPRPAPLLAGPLQLRPRCDARGAEARAVKRRRSASGSPSTRSCARSRASSGARSSRRPRSAPA